MPPWCVTLKKNLHHGDVQLQFPETGTMEKCMFELMGYNCKSVDYVMYTIEINENIVHTLHNGNFS